jgi:hypothetical protein
LIVGTEHCRNRTILIEVAGGSGERDGPGLTFCSCRLRLLEGVVREMFGYRNKIEFNL